MPSRWPANASSTGIARATEATREPAPSRGDIVLETRFPYLAPGLPRVKGGSADHGQLRARAREQARTRRGHLDGVLHLDPAPAVLVVGGLHAEHHPGLERRLAA